MIDAARPRGARRYFPRPRVSTTPRCNEAAVTPLKESDAYPAMAERGYGWEKLLSEMFCQEVG